MKGLYATTTAQTISRRVFQPTTSLSSSTRAANIGQWTCRRCASKQATQKSVRGYASKASNGNYGNSRSNGSRKNRRIVLAATATGGIGASVLAFGDDLKHTYGAAERSGRVASTLFANVNEYVASRRGVALAIVLLRSMANFSRS